VTLSPETLALNEKRAQGMGLIPRAEEPRRMDDREAKRFILAAGGLIDEARTRIFLIEHPTGADLERAQECLAEASQILRDLPGVMS